MRTLGRLLLVGAAALLGCRDTTETSSQGRILVHVSTSGATPQSDQYFVTLDGTRPLPISPNGSAVYDEVPVGAYVVHLLSLADNCEVSGSGNHRSVLVVGGNATEVSFSVICGLPETGGFRIVVWTEGAPIDEDGYRLSVSTTPQRTIGVYADERYEGLAPGQYLISLKGVAWFCKVAGGTPQLFTVVAGQVVQVSLRVRCGDEPGEPLP
jgi:hypothetical protein